MGSMINISVTGYVGSEPQTREVGDQRVTTFSVAVNRKVRSGGYIPHKRRIIPQA
jgi:single-stranded DNA-binding protein